MKIHLNGWRRLWLVSSLVWFVFVGVTEAKLFQTESERRGWWITMLELKVNLSTTDRNRISFEGLKQTRGNMSDGEWIEALPKFYPNVAFQDSLDRYRKDMENLTRDQLRATREIVTDAIVPPLLVYLGGMVMAWIIAGFRKSPPI